MENTLNQIDETFSKRITPGKYQNIFNSFYVKLVASFVLFAFFPVSLPGIGAIVEGECADMSGNFVGCPSEIYDRYLVTNFGAIKSFIIGHFDAYIDTSISAKIGLIVLILVTSYFVMSFVCIYAFSLAYKKIYTFFNKKTKKDIACLLVSLTISFLIFLVIVFLASWVASQLLGGLWVYSF